jgi:hypothetical protein
VSAGPPPETAASQPQVQTETPFESQRLRQVESHLVDTGTDSAPEVPGGQGVADIEYAEEDANSIHTKHSPYLPDSDASVGSFTPREGQESDYHLRRKPTAAEQPRQTIANRPSSTFTSPPVRDPGVSDPARVGHDGGGRRPSSIVDRSPELGSENAERRMSMRGGYQSYLSRKG